MQNFKEAIMGIAKGRESAYSKTKTEALSNEIETRIHEVIEILFKQTELGVRIYNEESDNFKLSIFRLPKEFITIFFNIPSDRIGFCLTSEEKFVLFLEESPDQILILGKQIQTKETREFALNRAIQLIKLQYEKVGDRYALKDNTGSTIDHKEIIIHIIKWLVN